MATTDENGVTTGPAQDETQPPDYVSPDSFSTDENLPGIASGFADDGSQQYAGTDPNEIQMTPEEDDHHLISAISQTPVPGEDPDEIQMPPEDAHQGGVATPAGWEDLQGVSAGTSQGHSASEGSSYGVTRSSNGYTEAGKKYAKGAFGEEDRRADLDIVRQRAQTDDYLAARDKANAAEVEYIKQKSVIDAKHLEELKQLHEEDVRFNKLQLHLEQTAAIHAQAAGAKHLANYQKDMVGVRELMKTSGNPLGGLDTTGGLALAAAAFTQGFLATKGVNINVTGQIDKWVDREMTYHQQQIENQQHLANKNLTLYNIARQGAHDDTETRARLRGFVIDGMRQQLQVESDRWGAASAKAEAFSKIAQLNEHEAGVIYTIKTTAEKAEMERRKEGITRGTAIANASREQAMLGITASHNRAMADNASKRLALDTRKQDFDEKKENKPKDGLPPLNQGMVADPQDYKRDAVTGKATSGGLFKWKVDYTQPTATVNETIKKIADIKANYTKQSGQLDRLRELAHSAKDYLGKPGASIASEEYRLYAQEAELLVQDIIHDKSGAAATDAEAQRKAALLAPARWYQKGNNDKLIDNYAEDVRKHATAQYQAMENIGLTVVPEAERAYSDKSAEVDPGGGQRNKENMMDADGGIKTGISKDVQTIVGQDPLVDKRGWEGPAKMVGDLMDDWSDKKPDLHTDKPTKAWQKFVGDAPQPKAALPIDDITRGIMDPQSYRDKHPGDELPNHDSDLQHELLLTLGEVGTSDRVDANVRRYSNTLHGMMVTLLRAQDNPEELKKLQGTISEMVEVLGE